MRSCMIWVRVVIVIVVVVPGQYQSPILLCRLRTIGRRSTCMKTRIVDLLFISLFSAICVLLLPHFLWFPRGSQLVEAVKARKKLIEMKYFCFNQNNLDFTGLFKFHKEESIKYSIHSTLNVGRSSRTSIPIVHSNKIL